MGFPAQCCVEGEWVSFGHLGTFGTLDDLVIPKSHCFEAFVPAIAIDGHREGTCLSGIAGRGRQDFSLCQLPVVRYHPVLVAWLCGTCSNLGKTLDFCISFLNGCSLCLASLKSLSDFAPNSSLAWHIAIFLLGCAGGKSREAVQAAINSTS